MTGGRGGGRGGRGTSWLCLYMARDSRLAGGLKYCQGVWTALCPWPCSSQSSDSAILSLTFMLCLAGIGGGCRRRLGMLRRGLFLGLQRCLCSSRRATRALQSVRICLPRCLLKSYLQSQMQTQAKEQSRLRRAMIRCQSQIFAFKLQDYSYLSARKARLI